MVDAEFTNAVSNGVHAAFLLAYVIAARRQQQRGTGGFTDLVVAFFALTFVLKVLGVFVHHDPGSSAAIAVWAVIGVGVIILHVLILRLLELPEGQHRAWIAFCVITAGLAGAFGSFAFMAVQVLTINGLAARRTTGLVRLGFAGVVVANIVWLVLRMGAEAWIGGTLPTADRYDNDVYHVLLIVSTFALYKGFSQSPADPSPA